MRIIEAERPPLGIHIGHIGGRLARVEEIPLNSGRSGGAEGVEGALQGLVKDGRIEDECVHRQIEALR